MIRLPRAYLIDLAEAADPGVMDHERRDCRRRDHAAAAAVTRPIRVVDLGQSDGDLDLTVYYDLATKIYHRR